MTRALLTALLAAALVGCGRSDDAPPQPSAPDTTAAPAALGVTTVADLVAATPNLRRLAALVERAGLRETLADTSRAITLFAPSDAALAAAASAGTDLDALAPDALAALLRGHVVPVRLFAADAFGAMELDAADGSALTLDGDGTGALTVRRGSAAARVTTPDLDAENGVVHVIDTLLPAP